MNTGGPAFPTPISPDGPDWLTGMTLRDYFAAKAMAGLILNEADQNIAEVESALAELSYGIADAMLAAREAAR